MRRHYGCSVHDFGTSGLRWREAYALILDAASDSGTPFGAELRGWRYPARQTDVATLRALVALLSRGDRKAEKQNEKALLPYRQEAESPQRPSVDAQEYTEATENLLAQFGIDPAIAQADITAAAARIDKQAN